VRALSLQALTTLLNIQLYFLLFLGQICEVIVGPGSRFKGKHSLDSDEEDDEEETKTSKYDMLASDDVDGMTGSLPLERGFGTRHWLWNEALKTNLAVAF